MLAKLEKGTGMAKSIDYGNLMHRAMRGLIQTVLKDVAANGLPGAHHFFITFDTNHPDVAIADWLKTRYPSEMTVVIQHWFENLTVTFHANHRLVRAVDAFAAKDVRMSTDELGGDAHGLAVLDHGAVDEVGHAELARNFRNGDGFALEGKRRGLRCHAQTGNLFQDHL